MGNCGSSEISASSYADIRERVADLCKEKDCGPILIRLAWHDAGTYCHKSDTGGPRGCMRHAGEGEATYGCNAGLHIAIKLLSDIKKDFPNVSHADFWALASCAAVEAMGGPHIPFRSGRVDAPEGKSVEDGRLPDGDKKADHIRDVFNRIGFNDQEIVALSGAHTVGKCHKDRSGFEGAWTAEPLKFDNSYFIDLLDKKWKKEKASTGNPQYGDGKGHMMLITDIALTKDKSMNKWVEKYAADENLFFEDFKDAYVKLLESGVKNLSTETY
eukprot:GFYU01006891.1.p1 GENE.GFYU01006891.1~~GFYU01006891.1.p1  ORF type:complete len:272 (-),score=88.38 GFYU01006891.1:237-1052(-)